MGVGSCFCLRKVELLPRSIAVESGQRFHPYLDRIAFRHDLCDLGCSAGSIGFEIITFAPECRDLSFVRPPHNPTARVIDTVAIVLVVTLARTHLPFASDGLPLAPERLQGLGTSMVGALGEFPGEVVQEGTVLDLDAVGQQQRSVRGGLQRESPVGNSLIREPGANHAIAATSDRQPPSVHPIGNSIVMTLRH
jgi:hypothetical protein